MATYAIGDIQGCFDSLMVLVRSLKLASGDQIWLCGDLVNRGPKSAEVLRWVKGQGSSVVCVLGNHDIHLLCTAAGKRKHKKRDTFGDVLGADDREVLLEWLRTRPLLHRQDGFCMVHAGLHPLWDVDLAAKLAAACATTLRDDSWSAWRKSHPVPPVWSTQLKGKLRLASAFSVLVGVRTLEGNRVETEFTGSPTDRPSGCEPWFANRHDEETIVFGHWAALGLHVGAKAIGLDTGCVWGNALTAIRLEDRQVFRQEALEREC